MDEPWQFIVAALAVLLPSGGATLYVAWLRRKIVAAEGDSVTATGAATVVQAATSLVAPLRRAVDDQARQVEELSGRVKVMESHVSVLWATVRDARPPTRRLRQRMPDDPDVAELHDILVSDLEGWKPVWPPDLEHDM